jgi:hypothetical protein
LAPCKLSESSNHCSRERLIHRRGGGELSSIFFVFEKLENWPTFALLFSWPSFGLLISTVTVTY